jgi:hypothetical protein
MTRARIILQTFLHDIDDNDLITFIDLDVSGYNERVLTLLSQYQIKSMSYA